MKLGRIKSLPDNAILVTMDITSLYTNIDHDEGANACFEMLEKRMNRKISSSLLKNLILLVLRSNVFRYSEKLYKQIKGTAMGTPMAVNYANIFLDKFENDMLDEYERSTNVRPLFWMRYIDDIFFIWYHDEISLKQFIKFCDNYSTLKKMKSNIKFETSTSKEAVNFLDVKVKITGNKIITSLYTKPTDAHLYLNSRSCHPQHIIKNIPKGQLIRVRRICSEDADYDFHAKKMKQYFVSRGYNEKYLQLINEDVRKLERNELLRDKAELLQKDSHMAFVCTWHPKLKQLPSILHQNYNILSADAKLSKTFTSKPTVTYKRKKNLLNYLCKNDIRNKKIQKEEKCRGCKLCKLVNTSKTITNKNTGTTIKIKPGATCKSTGIIYAINCKKCEKIYIGHTGDTMSNRYSKHKYDIKNRPKQNELASHCHDDHDIEKDLELFILDHGISSLQKRKFLEDRYICKLQTLHPSGE